MIGSFVVREKKSHAFESLKHIMGITPCSELVIHVTALQQLNR